ncbi:MAG: DotD/TraH family lipoprotein [Magnetococcales bacterium]|nr:DotD/TraH family lipoprotein [Magnetococcales bacterium]
MPAHRLTPRHPAATFICAALACLAVAPAGAEDGAIPPLVINTPFAPPESTTRATFSLVASNIPVDELLPSLARKAGLNIDMAPGVQGTVNINLTNRPLSEILAQIAAQTGIRHQIRDGHTLTILPKSRGEQARR